MLPYVSRHDCDVFMSDYWGKGGGDESGADWSALVWTVWPHPYRTLPYRMTQAAGPAAWPQVRTCFPPSFPGHALVARSRGFLPGPFPVNSLVAKQCKPVVPSIAQHPSYAFGSFSAVVHCTGEV